VSCECLWEALLAPVPTDELAPCFHQVRAANLLTKDAQWFLTALMRTCRGHTDQLSVPCGLCDKYREHRDCSQEAALEANMSANTSGSNSSANEATAEANTTAGANSSAGGAANGTGTRRLEVLLDAAGWRGLETEAAASWSWLRDTRWYGSQRSAVGAAAACGLLALGAWARR